MLHDTAAASVHVIILCAGAQFSVDAGVFAGVVQVRACNLAQELSGGEDCARTLLCATGCTN